jgi:hypothetical protein
MIFGIKKVSLPASSDDAASDSDKKYKNYIGISTSYFFEEWNVYQNNIAASII